MKFLRGYNSETLNLFSSWVLLLVDDGQVGPRKRRLPRLADRPKKASLLLVKAHHSHRNQGFCAEF